MSPSKLHDCIARLYDVAIPRRPPTWLLSTSMQSLVPSWASTHCVTLTHWGRDKMAVIFQTTYWNAFSWMKNFEFRLIFHWSLFLRVQLIIFLHWFRIWLGADLATSHYLNQWWSDYRRIYASLCLNEWTTETSAGFAIHNNFATINSLSDDLNSNSKPYLSINFF